LFDPCRLARQVKVVRGSKSARTRELLFDPCRLTRQVKVVRG
jgi:hypothetical protein